MIVRKLPGGKLLCIHQTSHALMAHDFCRHWGNRDFARPEPNSIVLAAIAQHDNGWTQWEQHPALNDDGSPMDFLHGPDGVEKIALWQRGVDHAYAQHPYMAVLVGRHASLLYGEDSSSSTVAFVARQQQLLTDMRQQFAGDPEMSAAFGDAAVVANTRILQFGDSASLQVVIPWAESRTFADCPIDSSGATVAIKMRIEGDAVTFSPWPFDVAAFAVNIHGRLLSQQQFAHEREYHAALQAAPIRTLRWSVVREL
ncbi:MAG: DUF3891 family protein [Caldilineaceae bacterium]|nr:DUF3891 family protein [Caldilineaceae bacterium]